MDRRKRVTKNENNRIRFCLSNINHLNKNIYLADILNELTSSSSLVIGNASLNTHKTSSSFYKTNDPQPKTFYFPTNDPIFQPTASPNVFLDNKLNPCSSSAFKTNGMLISSKKSYNNNLFLTPIKETEKVKPTYINSILKSSPHFNDFNGNNLTKKLNFEEDFEDFNSNSFMPQSRIFEEKKGIFSNINLNYLLIPETQSIKALQNVEFEQYNI